MLARLGSLVLLALLGFTELGALAQEALTINTPVGLGRLVPAPCCASVELTRPDALASRLTTADDDAQHLCQ